MTGVTVKFPDGSTYEAVLSEEAKEAVRLSFNPSRLTAVVKIKALAGAFITLCNELSLKSGSSPEFPGARREFATAKTRMQEASMWAVPGATMDTAARLNPASNQSPSE